MWFFTSLVLVAVALNGSSTFTSEPVHCNSVNYSPFKSQYGSRYSNLRVRQTWRQHWPYYHIIPGRVTPKHRPMQQYVYKFPNWKSPKQRPVQDYYRNLPKWKKAAQFNNLDFPDTMTPNHQMKHHGNLKLPSWKLQHVHPTEHFDINSHDNDNNDNNDGDDDNSSSNNNNNNNNNGNSVINDVLGSTSIQRNNTGSTLTSHTSHSYEGF